MNIARNKLNDLNLGIPVIGKLRLTQHGYILAKLLQPAFGGQDVSERPGEAIGAHGVIQHNSRIVYPHQLGQLVTARQDNREAAPQHVDHAAAP